MSTSLSKLVDNLSEIYSKKRRYKKSESEYEFKGLKNNKLPYNCKGCRKKHSKPINGLIEKFQSTLKFCSNITNKFILLLRKGFYPFEYMDSWERFNETTLRNKKAFYSRLYQDITDEDYIHAQKVFEELKFKT